MDAVPEEDMVGTVLGCVLVWRGEEAGRGEDWGLVVADEGDGRKWRRVGVWRQVWGEGTRLEVGGMFAGVWGGDEKELVIV